MSPRSRTRADQEDTAEVAIVVQDYWEGKGLGTILLNEILLNEILRHALSLADIHQRKAERGVTSLLFTRRDSPPLFGPVSVDRTGVLP